MREITIQLSDDDADLIAARTELVSDTLAGSATGRAMQAIQAELKAEEPEWEPQIGDIVKPNWPRADFQRAVLIGRSGSPMSVDGWAFVKFDNHGLPLELDCCNWCEPSSLTFVARPKLAP